jgi:hypothetical protein
VNCNSLIASALRAPQNSNSRKSAPAKRFFRKKHFAVLRLFAVLRGAQRLCDKAVARAVLVAVQVAVPVAVADRISVANLASSPGQPIGEGAAVSGMA